MFRRLFFSGLVGALATAGRADSRELPVIRNTQLGFNYQFHNHYWTPLRVEIDNPGPERHAVLVIEPASNAAGQTVTLVKPIWLPANSRRTIFLTVLPEYNETAPPIPKVLSAKLTDGGLQVWSQADILGRVIPETAALMLVGDARLTSYRIPPDVPAGFSKRAIERASVAPANLPARVIDYEGVSLSYSAIPARPRRCAILVSSATRGWQTNSWASSRIYRAGNSGKSWSRRWRN